MNMDDKVAQRYIYKEIFEYMRKRRHKQTRRVGVVVGINDNGVIRVGWSKCNEKDGDEFNLDEGLRIARERAFKVYNTPIPLCAKRQIRAFSSRCVRYFKDAKSMVIEQYEPKV